MRKDIHDDCRDFWSVLESTAIKTVPQSVVKSNRKSVSFVVAVCVCVVVSVCLIFPFLPRDTFTENNSMAAEPIQSQPIHSQPIITADRLDNFDVNFNDSDSPNTGVGRISKHLSEKMETAPSDALFRTVIADPRYLLFLKQYEEDGISYQKLTEGYGKENGYEWHSQKVEQMEKNARTAYAEKLANELGVENAEAPVHTSEFSIDENNLIANLTREQIYALKDIGCHLKLGFAKRDASVMPSLTDSLYEAIKSGETKAFKVLVVMKYDSMEYRQFNADYFDYEVLNSENYNTEYISDYMQGLIDEYSITVSEKSEFVGIKGFDDGYYVGLNFTAELTKNQIELISNDNRIRAIALYDANLPEADFRDDI